MQRQILFSGQRHEPAHDFMGFAERHATLHEPVGQISGEQQGVGSRLERALLAERGPVEHLGENGQCVRGGFHGIENRLLVFLHVAIVSERKPFHHREERHEVAIEPPGFPAGEFRDVGVLFLRHQARSRRVPIAEGDEPEFRRCP